MEITLASLLESKLKRDEARKYWLVRTSSGNDYESFKEHNFIGIGWNEIRLSDFRRLPPEELPGELTKEEAKNAKLTRRMILDELAARVMFDEDKVFVSEKSRAISAVKAIHQLETFIREIKKGDIVLIPSENSDFYSFGEVNESSVYIADSYEMARTNCDLIKRKSINWLEIDYPRHRLDPNYWKFVRVQNTIADISEYRFFIEKTINNNFILDGQSHFVFRVTENIELHTRHYKALLQLMDIAERLIAEDTGDWIEPAELKARVQSPGEFVSISQFLPYAGYCAAAVVLLVGGGLSFTKEAGFNLGTKGVWGRILESKKSKAEREEFVKNQEQTRRNQETVRALLELNPSFIKESEKVVLKLIENQPAGRLPDSKEDNGTSLQ